MVFTSRLQSNWLRCSGLVVSGSIRGKNLGGGQFNAVGADSKVRTSGRKESQVRWSARGQDCERSLRQGSSREE